MKFWYRLCKVFGYIWCVLAFIIILIGIWGVWLEKGFSGIQNLLSPFNIANWFVTVITLAPGIGLLILADKLKEKVRYKFKCHQCGTILIAARDESGTKSICPKCNVQFVIPNSI